VSFSTGWTLFYINTVTKGSARLVLFPALSAVTFLSMLILFWKHNQFAYKRKYAQWDRSFLCQRCGTLTWHE
jgi:hypothetical protein